MHWLAPIFIPIYNNNVWAWVLTRDYKGIEEEIFNLLHVAWLTFFNSCPVSLHNAISKDFPSFREKFIADGGIQKTDLGLDGGKRQSILYTFRARMLYQSMHQQGWAKYFQSNSITTPEKLMQLNYKLLALSYAIKSRGRIFCTMEYLCLKLPIKAI